MSVFYEKINEILFQKDISPPYGRVEDVKRISFSKIKNFYIQNFKRRKSTSIIVTGPFENKSLGKQIYSFFSKIENKKTQDRKRKELKSPKNNFFTIKPIKNTFLYSKIFILPQVKTLKQYLIYKLLAKTIFYSLNGEILKRIPASAKFDVRLEYMENTPVLYAMVYSFRKLDVYKSKYVLDYTIRELTTKGINEESFKTALNGLLTELLLDFQKKENRLIENAEYFDLTGKMLLKNQVYYTLLRLNKLDLYREANRLLKNRGIKIETK